LHYCKIFQKIENYCITLFHYHINIYGNAIEMIFDNPYLSKHLLEFVDINAIIALATTSHMWRKIIHYDSRYAMLRKCLPRCSLKKIARFGNSNLLKWFLDNHPELQLRNTSIMNMAAKYGNLELIYYLHKIVHLDITICLRGAIRNGDFSLFRYILENDKFKETSVKIVTIRNVVQYNNINFFPYLLSKYATEGVVESILLRAASLGRLDIVCYLANMVDIRSYGNELLYRACKNGHFKMVKYIINTMTLDAIDYYSALNDAARDGHFRIVRYLVNTLGDDIYKYNMTTVICSAISYGNLKMVRYLVNASDCLPYHNYQSLGYKPSISILMFLFNYSENINYS
jgi:hypothetical protein